MFPRALQRWMACVTTVKIRRFLSRWRRLCIFGIVVLLLFHVMQEPPPASYISDVSQVCIIPNLNPWDPSIRQYVWDLKPLVCDAAPAVVFLDDTGTLQYNVTALQKLGLKESNVKCQYKILLRQPHDEQVTFTSAVPFNPPFRVDSDFFHVTCTTSRGKGVLNKLFSSVIKPEHPRTTKMQEESKDQLSVLLFAVDSVSRSQSIRKLPKTVKYLKEQLNAYDFEGFMNVGGGTFQNIVPLLTGHVAWSSENPTLNFATDPFDSYPFIWKNYSREGYATLYAEDLVRAGTFHFGLKGFKVQPTDHYQYPYWMAINAIDSNTYINYAFEMMENRNVHLKATSSLCYSGKAKHMIQSDYVRQFYRRYRGIRKFSFSLIGEISHDFNNLLGLADDDFVSFLKWLRSDGHLNNTLLVFFSDHGSRVDAIRNTNIGRIEHRMPMLYIVVPDHIKATYPALVKSMHINTKRLSTPYDLHQTLMDVLSQSFKSPTKLYYKDSLRGISLFQPLPSQRTCAEATIPEDVCSCYASLQVNITQDQYISIVADFMVNNINARMSKVPSCAKLKLFRVQEAKRISQPLKRTGKENTRSVFNFFRTENKPSRRYFVVIETIPGHGAFDGTVDISSVTGPISLVGDIERANRYGNQSSCVEDRNLKPFCYCSD